MGVPNTFTGGTTAESAKVNNNYTAVLNQRCWNNDTIIGPGEYRKAYLHIDNAYGTRRVLLYLYGEAPFGVIPVPQHTHQTNQLNMSGYGSFVTSNPSEASNLKNTVNNSDATSVGNVRTGGGTGQITGIIGTTSVPQGVKIYIDGVDKTSTIGNPNARPSSDYNAGTPSWGNSAGVNWYSGILDISSVISWTAGEHTIEFRETGNAGGRLLYSIYSD